MTDMTSDIYRIITEGFADMTSENPLLLIILDLYNVSLLF